MSMNTRKQVGASRKKAIADLKSGQWKKDFDKAYNSYLSTTDEEAKESHLSSMRLLSFKWGISGFPELIQYAKDKLASIGHSR